MNFAEIDAITTEMASVVRDAIAAATGPLRDEISALRAENVELARRVDVAEAREIPVFDPSGIEARLSELTDLAKARPDIPEMPELPDFDAMIVGAVAEGLELVRAEVREDSIKAAQEAVESLPKPKDGKDADPAELESLRVEIAAVKAAIPVVEPPDLSELATKQEVEAVAAWAIEPKDYTDEIAALREDVGETRKALDAIQIPPPDPLPDLSVYALKSDIPAARDYETEIALLAQRIESLKMPEVIHGKDGVGIADIKQNADGELIFKATNGETFNVGVVRGADGLGFEDMAVEYDGERSLALMFSQGERVVRREIVLPIVIDRGVWKEAQTYQRGDAVTWAGSVWIAQKETTGKPDAGDFRLSVKKGRDGKPGAAPAESPRTVKR